MGKWIPLGMYLTGTYKARTLTSLSQNFVPLQRVTTNPTDWVPSHRRAAGRVRFKVPTSTTPSAICLRRQDRPTIRFGTQVGSLIPRLDSTTTACGITQPSAGRFLSEDPLTFGGGNNFYVYVRNNPVVLIDPFGLREPTAQEMQNIINAAQDWAVSNVPYVYGGKSKKGADCSGSVWSIYDQAGLPYDYTTASGLPKNPRFVPVSPGNQQPGDVGWCPNHIVIYDPNAGQQRNVWSASHTGGPAFGPGNSSWYCHDMKWYRYDVPEECHDKSCSKGKQ